MYAYARCAWQSAAHRTRQSHADYRQWPPATQNSPLSTQLNRAATERDRHDASEFSGSHH